MESKYKFKRKKPLKEFTQTLETKKKGISKLLILPNFVEEYTNSTFMLIFFFVCSYFIYLKLMVLYTNVYEPPEDSFITKIRNNIEEKNKLQLQEERHNTSTTNNSDYARILSNSNEEHGIGITGFTLEVINGYYKYINIKKNASDGLTERSLQESNQNQNVITANKKYEVTKVDFINVASFLAEV